VLCTPFEHKKFTCPEIRPGLNSIYTRLAEFFQGVERLKNFLFFLPGGKNILFSVRINVTDAMVLRLYIKKYSNISKIAEKYILSA
jgi:hypothetical protein